MESQAATRPPTSPLPEIAKCLEEDGIFFWIDMMQVGMFVAAKVPNIEHPTVLCVPVSAASI